MKSDKAVLEEIGLRITQLRVKAGYGSYEAFAIDNELSRMQYWRLEKGLTNMTIKTLKKVLDLHGLTIEKFFAMSPSSTKQ